MKNKDITSRFLAMFYYYSSKYSFKPEEIAEWNEISADICEMEYDKEIAEYFFGTPVDFYTGEKIEEKVIS